MIDWLKDLSVLQIVLLAFGVLVVLTIVGALLTRALVRRGIHTPFVVRRLNLLLEWVVDLVRRPITIAVLDEVADVIQTGHYTKNISGPGREP